MKIQPYFEKIHKEIEARLLETKSSIRLAVAWFTDERLFKIICDKAKDGIKVELLIANQEINHESSIKFSNLTENGGKIYWIGKGYNYEKLMHNKACIIDNSILITGSYNWTRKAKSNHENILVIEDEENLILDFNQEFDKIINKYFNKENRQVDWEKIVIRLETLLNAIKLEDEEDVSYQVKKIKDLIPKDIIDNKVNELSKIIHHCQKKSYSNAIALILNYTKEHKQLIIYNDPEIPALKLEVRVLEYQVSCLEDEKTEIEKQINHYKIEYNLNLGEIIKEILFLKRKLAQHEFEKDKEKLNEFEEAKKDFEDFNNAFQDNLKEPKPQNLDEEQLKELKQNYRKATKFCHPDKVTEEQKEQAQKLFNDLKEAYDNNDLQKVNSILKNLEKGIFKSQGETITEKDKLKLIKESLKIKEKGLIKELTKINKSLTYREIEKISDWDNYFENLKLDFCNVLKDLHVKNNLNGK
jgi:hypothetical protein